MQNMFLDLHSRAADQVLPWVEEKLGTTSGEKLSFIGIECSRTKCKLTVTLKDKCTQCHRKEASQKLVNRKMRFKPSPA